MAIDKVTSAALETSTNQPGFRNIIINGDMSIAQRGTSQTGTTSSGYYTVDRMYFSVSSAGTWTQTQSTDVPTGQGFSSSWKIDCTTANASLSAGSILSAMHRLEGQMLQYLKKGTANAESLTLSFWIKSNKTGTYIAEIKDTDNTRIISKSYTINVADTWEKKTITFEGDTTGAFTNDNGLSCLVSFWLAAGTDYTSGTLATSWENQVSANRAVGQVNLADSTSNELYLTGVQLEAGTSASDFEFLPVDVNLDRCYRYFQMMHSGSANKGMGLGWYSSNTNARFVPVMKKTMRSTPSFYQTTSSDGFRLFTAGGGNDNITSWSVQDSTNKNFALGYNTSEASGTGGQVGYVLTNNDSNYFGLEAEL